MICVRHPRGKKKTGKKKTGNETSTTTGMGTPT